MCRCVLAIALALASCEAGDEAAVCTDAGPTKEFAEPCRSDCECLSDLCFTYGDGTSACTIECSADDDCPEGSQGNKCNGQGVCRS